MLVEMYHYYYYIAYFPHFVCWKSCQYFEDYNTEGFSLISFILYITLILCNILFQVLFDKPVLRFKETLSFYFSLFWTSFVNFWLNNMIYLWILDVSPTMLSVVNGENILFKNLLLFYQKKISPMFALFLFLLLLWAETKSDPENSQQIVFHHVFILRWKWWWFYVLCVTDNNKYYMMMWWMNKWMRIPFIVVHCSILLSFIAWKIA